MSSLRSLPAWRVRRLKVEPDSDGFSAEDNDLVLPEPSEQHTLQQLQQQQPLSTPLELFFKSEETWSTPSSSPEPASAGPGPGLNSRSAVGQHLVPAPPSAYSSTGGPAWPSGANGADTVWTRCLVCWHGDQVGAADQWSTCQRHTGPAAIVSVFYRSPLGHMYTSRHQLSQLLEHWQQMGLCCDNVSFDCVPLAAIPTGDRGSGSGILSADRRPHRRPDAIRCREQFIFPRMCVTVLLEPLSDHDIRCATESANVRHSADTHSSSSHQWHDDHSYDEDRPEKEQDVTEIGTLVPLGTKLPLSYLSRAYLKPFIYGWFRRVVQCMCAGDDVKSVEVLVSYISPDGVVISSETSLAEYLLHNAHPQLDAESFLFAPTLVDGAGRGEQAWLRYPDPVPCSASSARHGVSAPPTHSQMISAPPTRCPICQSDSARPATHKLSIALGQLNGFGHVTAARFPQFGDGRPGHISDPGSGQISGPVRGQISSSGRGRILGFGRGRISGSGRGRISGSGRGRISGSGRGRISGSGNGRISGSGRGRISGSGRGRISGSGRGRISGSGRGRISGSGRGRISGSGHGRISGSGRGRISGSCRGRISGSGRGRISGSGRGRVARKRVCSPSVGRGKRSRTDVPFGDWSGDMSSDSDSDCQLVAAGSAVQVPYDGCRPLDSDISEDDDLPTFDWTHSSMSEGSETTSLYREPMSSV